MKENFIRRRSSDRCNRQRRQCLEQTRDKLIEDGCTGQVTIIPIGVGGVEISAWAKGGPLHNRLIETVEQLKEQHITPDCILWHQGESDNISNTSEENYIACLKPYAKYSEAEE